VASSITALRLAVLWLADGTDAGFAGGSEKGPWLDPGESAITVVVFESRGVAERLGDGTSGVLGFDVLTFLTLPTRTTMAR